MSQKFLHIYNQYSKPDALAARDLLDALKTISVEKGEYLLKSGKVCKALYFIDSGLCKTSFYKKDKEFIMRFFTEGALFTVIDSFVAQVPSNYEILALEPTTCTYINFEDLEKLSLKHHQIETFFRKLMSQAAVNMMKRISEMLEDNASERYAHFLKNNSDLLQRISLGDLAGYLGITQVSLSRIRAQK
jgi:CRP-like cAMP-binding protein